MVNGGPSTARAAAAHGARRSGPGKDDIGKLANGFIGRPAETAPGRPPPPTCGGGPLAAGKKFSKAIRKSAPVTGITAASLGPGQGRRSTGSQVEAASRPAIRAVRRTQAQRLRCTGPRRATCANNSMFMPWPAATAAARHAAGHARAASGKPWLTLQVDRRGNSSRRRSRPAMRIQEDRHTGRAGR